MKTKKIKTGSKELDKFLGGGLDSDIITTFYGPAGSGKTLICILAALQAVKDGKKVLYVDTEGGFSVERLSQLDDDYELVLNHINFLNPTNFEEQKKVFEMLRNYLVISGTQKNSKDFSSELKELISKDIGMIIIDSIAMLYRIELGKSDAVYATNKELGIQIAMLTEIARKKNIPVLLTNQVYADFDQKDRVKMVGGDILKYGSKCLIELYKDDDKRKMVLVKHRAIKDGKELEFNIVKKGIEK